MTNLLSPGWRAAVRAMSQLADVPVTDFPSFLLALRARRRQFMDLGATSSDHGAERPLALSLSEEEAEAIFQKALSGGASSGGGVSAEEARRFGAHMLLESARMSADDGLVMQLHAGVRRNHDPALLAKYGPDKGADIPLAAEWTDGLAPLLRELGNHPNLTLVLFTLDESTYSRELAPLAGYYRVRRVGRGEEFLSLSLAQRNSRLAIGRPCVFRMLIVHPSSRPHSLSTLHSPPRHSFSIIPNPAAFTSSPFPYPLPYPRPPPQAVRLGPPWWFHDSRLGMRRFLDATVETAGVANLAGFNDDTRAFLSIPARRGAPPVFRCPGHAAFRSLGFRRIQPGTSTGLSIDRVT